MSFVSHIYELHYNEMVTYVIQLCGPCYKTLPSVAPVLCAK